MEQKALLLLKEVSLWLSVPPVPEYIRWGHSSAYFGVSIAFFEAETPGYETGLAALELECELTNFCIPSFRSMPVKLIRN